MTTSEIIKKLRQYYNLMEELQLLLSRRPISNRPKLQDLLTEIKSKLKADYDTMSKVRYRKEMTSEESAFLYPAIHEAYTKIHVKTNSTPSSKWASELYDAQNTISYYLDQLENSEP